METAGKTLERIPSFEELEIAYFDLERRSRLGEKLPPHRITVMLQNKNQFTGILVEPTVKGDSLQAALRLDTPESEIVIFRRGEVSVCLLNDIRECGYCFFETWLPEGPNPGPLELRTQAKEIEQLFQKLFGKARTVTLPSLPALKPGQPLALNQCLLDLYWVVRDMCRDEIAKAELGSKIAGFEFRTAESAEAGASIKFSDGILAMESAWARCFSSASGRAELRRKIEALF